jgi:SDR family mycofactocin-dependent oxidoreductase
MAGRVEGKIALVTGAARGQGRAEAIRLAQEGADLILVDIADTLPSVPYASSTPADLDETVSLVEKTGKRAVRVQADVRDLAALRAGVDDGVVQLGGLDIVVANAGICVPATWDNVTEQIFDDTIGINVRGVWNTVMVGAPHVIERGAGSIILISSSAGLKAPPFLVPYTTSKWAVRGMAKAFAVEFAKHHIRVNSVHPTGVNTEMGRGEVMDIFAKGFEQDPRLGPLLQNLLPVEGTEPEDVADTVLFLASDESKYVTAHELAPDAGISAF